MSKNSMINFNKQSGSLDVVINEKFIADNYDYASSFEKINLKNLEALLKKENFKKYTFPIDVNTYSSKYIHEDGTLIDGFCSKLENNSDIGIFTKNLDSLEKWYNLIFNKILKPTLLEENVQIVYSELSLTSIGLKIIKKIFKEKDFSKINENYYPDLDADIFAERFLTEGENIVLLNGQSGTGKTKFFSLLLKKFLGKKELISQNRSIAKVDTNEENYEDDYYVTQNNTFNIKVAYTKNKALLQSDDFWDHIKSSNYDFIILDDIYLTARDETQEDGFVSQLLSYSDGLMPSSTKFLISSNNEDYQIDNAILRAGRLFESLDLIPLTKEEALNVWISENLEADLFYKYFNDKSEILQADLGSTIKKLSIGKNNIKSYFKKNNEKMSKKGRKTKKVVGFHP